MPTERKVASVAELSDKLGRAQVTIVTDYRGLKVHEMQTLRGQLRPLGSEVKVVKNTLTTIAAREQGLTALEPALTGPSALVFVYQDVAGTSKVIADFVRTSRILTVRGGLIGNQFVTPEQVSSLATLPPKDQLRAEALGALVGPISGLVGIFNSVAQSLVSILDQKAQQGAGTGDGATSES
jgi:large subunit ribosomal protein L10